MREEMDCGWWGEALVMEIGGWDAPLGGLVASGSSSEELSSDAPRINLRRFLASGPDLNIGTLVLGGFWVVDGSGVCSEFALDEACWTSVCTVVTCVPAEEMLALGRLSSLCGEVVATVDRDCSPKQEESVAGMSSLAAGEPQPDGDSSPFSDIATVFVLILLSRNRIHRIIPKTANVSI